MPKAKIKQGTGNQLKTYVYPLGVKGELIGTPGVGTHTLGNWESDNAVDLGVGEGTPVIAVADGIIGSSIGSLGSSNPTMAGLRFHLETKGNEFYYAHLSRLNVKAGQSVRQGDICGYSGSANGVAHLHFASLNGNPLDIIRGEITAPTNRGVTSGVDIATVEATAKAAAFSTYLELPGVLDSAESMALQGGRSLMNDQPLFSFIEQLTRASLRRFQSMPNGNFFAFYPDYFGGMNHRTPYWEIHDIEILDGRMNLSDDALATHVYVVGDTVGYFDGVTTEDEAASAGVVTLFQAMASNFITGLGPTQSAPKRAQALATKDQVITFLKKYGARPYFEEAPMVRSGYYEMFLAFQRFCMLWSQQFVAEFQLTYMPELFPGGLVALPEHGLQLFIEEVSHDCDYENGFTTTVLFSSPASLKHGPAGLHDGMIRSSALHPDNN